jgi:hypothetical protein
VQNTQPSLIDVPTLVNCGRSKTLLRRMFAHGYTIDEVQLETGIDIEVLSTLALRVAGLQLIDAEVERALEEAVPVQLDRIFVPVGPLVSLVLHLAKHHLTRSNDGDLAFLGQYRRAYYRAVHRGEVSVNLADQLCIFLGSHPALLWPEDGI